MAENEKAEIRPVDLAIRVTTPWASGSTALEYTLDSPVAGLQMHQLAIRGPRLLSSPEKFQQRLLGELELLRKRHPDGQRLSSSEVADEAAGIGQNLFRTLFAGEMGNIYRQLPREIETLLITSDEPWIPWELLHDGEEFLCLRFRVGRWLAGGRAPTTELAIRNLLGLRASAAASKWDDLDVLRQLESACEGLVGTYGEGVSFQRLREHLLATTFDLFHFSGHGEHALEESLEPRIHTEDRPFRPRNIPPAIQSKLRLQSAFIFFNSCQVGRVGTALTGLEGWAQTWIDCGCAGFLAPSWSVSAASANIFCRSFYGGLARGLDLGAAVQEARRELYRRHPGDLAWLAYALYGAPQARLLFGVSGGSTVPPSLPLNVALRRAEHDWGTELGPDLGPAGNWGKKSRLRWRFANAGLAVLLVVAIALVFRSQQAGLQPGTAERASGSIDEASSPTEPHADQDNQGGQLKAGESEPPGDAKRTGDAITATPSSPTEPHADQDNQGGQLKAGGSEPPGNAKRTGDAITVTPPLAEPRDKQADKLEKNRDERQPPTVAVIPRVPGRVAILAMRTLDPAVLSALQASLRQIDGVEPLAVAGLYQPAKGGDWTRAAGSTDSGPWGAQYWLYVGAEFQSINSPISSQRSVAVSLDAVLMDPSNGAILVRGEATHTGIGGTTNAALLQGVTRCLQEITNTLEERSTS